MTTDAQSAERAAVLALVRPMVNKYRHLSIDARVALLTGLLAQEICTCPPGERELRMRQIQQRLPAILATTERAMRQALEENIREENQQ